MVNWFRVYEREERETKKCNVVREKGSVVQETLRMKYHEERNPSPHGRERERERSSIVFSKKRRGGNGLAGERLSRAKLSLPE